MATVGGPLLATAVVGPPMAVVVGLCGHCGRSPVAATVATVIGALGHNGECLRLPCEGPETMVHTRGCCGGLSVALMASVMAAMVPLAAGTGAQAFSPQSSPSMKTGR